MMPRLWTETRTDLRLCGTMSAQVKTARGAGALTPTAVPGPRIAPPSGEEVLTVAHIMPPETDSDAMVPSKPISRELSLELAPTIMRTIRVTRGGCWVRTTAINPQTGYSSVCKKIDGKPSYFYAHRVMYVFHKGPIRAGLTVDHICEVRACCNPAHLQAVTLRQNVLRSDGNPFAKNWRTKGRCRRGHKLRGTEGQRRWCPTCASAVAKRRAEAKAAKDV